MVNKSLFAMFVLVILGGCLPAVDFRSPVVRGRVLDAMSGQPLPSATIMLQQFPDVFTWTDNHGNFVLPPKTNHTWCVALPDNCLIRLRDVGIVVSAPGYRSERLQIKPAQSGGDEVYVTPRLDHE